GPPDPPTGFTDRIHRGVRPVAVGPVSTAVNAPRARPVAPPGQDGVDPGGASGRAASVRTRSTRAGSSWPPIARGGGPRTGAGAGASHAAPDRGSPRGG